MLDREYDERMGAQRARRRELRRAIEQDPDQAWAHVALEQCEEQIAELEETPLVPPYLIGWTRHKH